MKSAFLSTFLIPIILILLVLGILSFILKQMHSTKLEKRFEAFSLQSNKEQIISIFDEMAILFWKTIHKLSFLFEKSQVLTEYAKKYERFIPFEEKERKESIDYIAIKVIIGIVFVLLNIISIFIHKKTNFITLLCSFLLGFFLPDITLTIKFKNKRKQIEEELLKAIIIMNNSFKSGRNIMQAIQIVKTELEGPIADEFKKIYLDITYGLSLEVVFNRFYERVKLEDAKYIASSLTLLSKTGGNIVSVFESIEKSFFDKKKLQNEMKSLTAASVFVFRVLVSLPLFFSFIIFILNPTYFNPLFSSGLGILLLLAIIFLYINYILVIRKAMKVKM